VNVNKARRDQGAVRVDFAPPFATDMTDLGNLPIGYRNIGGKRRLTCAVYYRSRAHY
jgi:hypothetical protein